MYMPGSITVDPRAVLEEKTIAIMDLGSNSLRLMLAHVQPDGSYAVLNQVKQMVRLGEGAFQHGRLREESMARTIAVLRGMASMCEVYGVSETIAVATAAVRDAANGEEFLARVREKTGITFTAISGQEEARLIYLGVSSGLEHTDALRLFIDIGGGSTELIVGSSDECRNLDSMKLGCVRLSNLFFDDGEKPVPVKRYTALQNYIRNNALHSFQRIADFTITEAVGSSGTAQNLAEISAALDEADAQAQGRKPVERRDLLSYAGLCRVVRELCARTLKERKTLPGINANRADVIIAGAAILQTIMAFGIFDRKQKDESIPLDNPASRETSLALAREGIVMLKNDDGVLPLRGTTALVGPNATVITTGGGSGNVVPFTETTVSEALAKMKPKTIMLTDDVIYEDIADQVFTDSTMKTKGFRGEYFKNKGLKGDADVLRVDPKVDFDWQYGRPMDGFPTDTFSVRWSGCYTAKTDETLKIYIGGDDGYRIKVNGKTVAGDWGNHAYSFRELALKVKAGVRNDIVVEYFDNISSANIKVSMKRLNEKKLFEGIRKADNVVYCAGFNSSIEGEGFDRPFELPQFQREMIGRIADANPNMVVVVNAGGGIAFKPWIDKVKGVLMAWYPGQEGGQAIAEILRGKLSPSGKLPISIEEKLEDNPSYENYHENMQGRELRSVEYREGVFMGYRGYDKTGVKPLFHFGFGLSYSTFEYSGLTLEKTGDNEVKVAFNVKNTGKMEAKETAQVYVSDRQSLVKRPLKELKNFEKVSLKPGETKRVELTLDKEAFAYYDVMQQQFVVEPGTFTVSVGGSSADLPLKQDIEL